MNKYLRKITTILTLLTTYSFVISGQEVAVITELHEIISETSGLIYLNQKLITHNDSEGEPVLYEIDSITGDISRKVFIDNAENIDWEDICYDNSYIYIADIGNNNGTRNDLKIYRILISEYFNTPNDTVTVDAVINYSYGDQTDFTPSPFQTNYDAETLISYNDSLYIFTKNWLDLKTNIYAVPKIPCTYEVSRIDSIDTQGLITGADYDPISSSILLTGYTLSPFVIKITQIISNKFSTGNIEIFSIQPQNSIQIEAVSHINEYQYYLTAEAHTSGSASLYKLTLEPYSFTPERADNLMVSVYPNPFSSSTNIKYTLNKPSRVFINIYDNSGKLVYKIDEFRSSGEQYYHWDAKHHTPGIYSYEIRIGESIGGGKLIKTW